MARATTWYYYVLLVMIVVVRLSTLNDEWRMNECHNPGGVQSRWARPAGARIQVQQYMLMAG